MNKKMKRLSKSTISVLLALLMIVSTVTVGIIATNAAYVDNSTGAKADSDSVGWSGFKIVGNYNGKVGDWSGTSLDSDGYDGDKPKYKIRVLFENNAEFHFLADGTAITNSTNSNVSSGYSQKMSSGSSNLKWVGGKGYVDIHINSDGWAWFDNFTAAETGSYVKGLDGNWSDYHSMTLSSGTTYYYNVQGDGTTKYFRFKTDGTKYDAHNDGYDLYSGGNTSSSNPYGAHSGDANAFKFTAESGYLYKIYVNGSNVWVTRTQNNHTVTYDYVTGQNSNYGTITATKNGTSIGSSPASVAPGSTVVLKATPKFGYDFDGWYTNQNGITRVSTDAELTLNVTTDTARYAKFKTATADKYYLGGRMAIATAAANINANTTGANDGTHEDQYGIDKTTNSISTDSPINYWTFNETSTNIKFKKESANRYYLDTYRTISQLSETHTRSGGTTSHDPFYFIIHDKLHRYGGTTNSGANFESNTASSPLPLTAYTGSVATSNELVFSQFDNQSNGQVRLWIDDSDGIKIWYTLEDETPGVASRVTLSASPAKAKTNSNITLTARAVEPSENEENLRYTFYKSSDGTSWTQIGTANQTSNTLTTTESSQGTYKYRVVVSSVNTASYSSRKAETSAQFYTPGIYMSNHIANTSSVSWSDNLTSYATSPTPYKRTTSTNYTPTNPYVFTLSYTGSWDKDFDFDDYEIVDSDCLFCTIEPTYVDVTLDDGETAIRTYTVTPNTNCKNPTIYVDFKNKKIWAVAEYTAPAKGNTSNYSSEKVTYYFAEKTDNAYKSNPNGVSYSNNEGMRIHYWNNSNPNNLYGDANVTTKVTVSGSNSIWINTEALFQDNTGNLSGRKEFKVYKVDLPIWATSFQFRTGNNGTFQAVPTTTNEDYITDHSITLNPNRIYLLFNSNANGATDSNWRVKGVILDESMWNSGRSTDMNEVKTKNIDTNIINYTDNDRLQNPDKPNWALSSAYSAFTTPWSLYFGYMSTSNTTVATGQEGIENDYNNWGSALYNLGKNNKQQWAANLAQRKNDQSYYASVQELVGMTTSKTKFNKNGDGSTFGYLMDTKSVNTTTGKSTASLDPIFNYDALGNYSHATHGSTTSTIAQGKKFPFYESTLNGITTYSFDSTTDRNRVYSGGQFSIQGRSTSNGYATGKDSDNKHYTGLFPFGGNDNSFANCGFGIEFDLNFYMSNTGHLVDSNGEAQDIAFNFSGDDDVWVFVDGVKVLDLGGTHKVSAATINFTDKKVYYKSSAASINSSVVSNGGVKGTWAANDNSYINVVDLGQLLAAYGVDFNEKDAAKKHTFQMFYLERGAFQSNCVISFNLPQASGLNVKNNVTVDNVNPGLKQAALYASNSDNFTYQVQGRLVNGALPSAISSAAKAPATDNSGLEFSTPLYPYTYETKRVYNDGVNPTISFMLSSAGGTGSAGSSLTYNTSGWTMVANTVYGLTDPYIQATTAGKAAVTGKTEADGDFHLLGGEMATFDNKVPMNSYVKVTQTVDLGGVNNTSPITFKEITNNSTGNYYLTSYSVYDEKALKYIVDKTDLDVDLENDHSAADSRLNGTSGDGGFYFSNYTGVADDNNAAMTVEFTNDIAVGTIRIQKKLDDHSTPDATFRYKVRFARIFGNNEYLMNEYKSLEYKVFNEDGTPVYAAAQIYGNGGIAIKAGQYAEIYGVPVETAYEVEEQSTAGYSFKQLDKTTYKSNGVTKVYTTTDGGEKKYYEEHVTDNPRTSANMLWVENEGGSDPFVYYVNMIPPVSETKMGSSRTDYISRSDVVFTNQKNHFTVTFKYYDRDTTDNQPASISNKETEYSKRWDAIDDYIVYEDDGVTFKKIRFEDLIKASVKEFETDTNVSNLIDDYHMWTTQASALAGIKNEINLHTGEKYSVGNADSVLKYHTTRNGEVNTSGDYWVNYITENNLNRDAESFADGALNDYDSIRTIVVWLYNVPKAYDVNVYGATTTNDLKNAKDITIADGNGLLTSGIQITDARVAKVNTTSKISDTFYYSQRLGTAKDDPDYLDKIAYLEAYGVPAYKGVDTTVIAPDTLGDLKFVYWAYDPEGEVVASTDWRFGYRVTGQFDLYAVYAPNALEKGNTENNKFGLTIKEDATDTYVDSNGNPKIRLNVMFNPFNLHDYDTNIQGAGLLNIYTTNLITKLKSQGQNDEQIKATILQLQDQYKEQLLSMLNNLALNQKLNLTGYTPAIQLTARGYVYTTNGAGTSVNLTNKNRLQMSTQFSKSSLYSDGVTTGILQIGAMKYNGTWILSDNSIYRTFSMT
ncbi:MAG: hypothetical protein UFA98_03820 [Ruminococcus sp.]|nr:hypothetical protein [Ruminococcus sp.]